jgi:hypothetical protein
LYQITKYYWYLYPSKDIATEALKAADLDHAERQGPAKATAACWSKVLKCKVLYLEQSTMFMLLEQDGKYCKVLSTNGDRGWIIYLRNEVWSKGCIEEVKQ